MLDDRRAAADGGASPRTARPATSRTATGTTRRRTPPRPPGRDPAPMSAPADDGPFVWNVAGLLGDTVGADRHYEVADARVDLPDELALAEPIDGHVRLTRTNRGILADADLRTALAMECVRCLRPTTTSRSSSAIEEEYLPSLDLATGQARGDRRRARGPAPDRPPRARPGAVRPRRDLAGRADRPAGPPGLPGPVHGLRPAARRGHARPPDDDIDPRLEALRGVPTRRRRTDEPGPFRGRLRASVRPRALDPARPTSRPPRATTYDTRSPRPHGCTQATRLACPPGRAPLAPRDRPARRSRSVRTATR